MLVRVKLFGPPGRAVGAPQLTVRLDDPAATCAALRVRLMQCEPRLAPWLSGCRFAVNQEFAGEDQPIGAEDEIALIGFVSGG